MTAEKVKRASYTLEYKLEAVRLVQSGQSCAATAKVLGIPSQTLENLVRQATKGQLTGAGAKPVSAGVFMESSLNPIVYSSESPSFARFLMGHAVTDVVDAFEGGNDLLVVRDDDDRGLELACHVIEDADDGHGALRYRAAPSAHRPESPAGRLTRPRAMATRCCSPPDSCDGMARARCCTSSAVSSSSALRARLRVGDPGQHRQQAPRCR
jgi:transposase-like protein